MYTLTYDFYDPDDKYNDGDFEYEIDDDDAISVLVDKYTKEDITEFLRDAFIGASEEDKTYFEELNIYTIEDVYDVIDSIYDNKASLSDLIAHFADENGLEYFDINNYLHDAFKEDAYEEYKHFLYDEDEEHEHNYWKDQGLK